jgi:single-strand binding protein
MNFLIGNLTADAEVKETANKKIKAQFTLAANTQYVTAEGEIKEQTTFLRIVAWGKLAEACRGLAKGQKVMVSGRNLVVKYRGEDGITRYYPQIVAEFIGSSLLNNERSYFDYADADADTYDEEVPF